MQSINIPDGFLYQYKTVVYITLEILLSTLKPRQLEAIKHTKAPQLILAGAGTGKTTTITAKSHTCSKVLEKTLNQ